jgi:peptide/nickel transport system permease protein
MRLRDRYTRRYLFNRVASLIGILLAVLVINFLLPHLLPGSFVETYATIIAGAHHLPYDQVYLRLVKIFGTPQPLPIAFVQYMEQVLTTFPPNFGPSFQYFPLPAWTVVLDALKWTLLLLGTSQVIAWGASIFIGVYLALHKDRAIDRVLQPAFYFLNSIPAFWLGLMFIFIFALDLKILPPALAFEGSPTVPSVLIHMILPLSVLVLTSIPSHVVVIRSAAIDVLGSDFMAAGKAQGLSNRRTLLRLMRNSLIPSVTQVFLSVGYLIGGVITVEYTFSYPGMGTIIAQAVTLEDFPIMQAAFYVVTLVVLFSNLAADLIYPLIDPRVSYATE